MKAWRKLTNNILNRQAVAVLGLSTYTRLLAELPLRSVAIARAGDLRPLDRAMAGATSSFQFAGRRIRFDCAFADRLIHDGTYAFGIVREILVRDCYLKHLPADTLHDLGRVVDLGANRGMFTVLAAAFARQVLSIDADARFRPVIEHNARINGFGHISVDTAFVGAGGALGAGARAGADLSDILGRHGLETVDLMKMDIEGSEFALFRQPAWLRRVRRLSMEVHPRHGDPQEIVACLREHGFAMAFADGDLQQVASEAAFAYLYAWR
jgi:hypothetical protein